MRLISDTARVTTGPITAASRAFDPFSPETLDNPYPLLAELRGTEPVFYSPKIGAWVVTRHATIRSVLRDTRRFSSLAALDPHRPLCPHARSMIEQSGFHVPAMLVNNDPPSHTRYRKFFSAPLQRARISALEPFIRTVVTGHIDRLIEGRKPADLVAGLTWGIPALVLFKLLGIPDEDVEQVKKWAGSRLVLAWGEPSDEEQISLSSDAIDYLNYARELVNRKLEKPGDDYVSDLLKARNGDDSVMTLHEIAGMAYQFLFAGHETTSSAASNMFKAVLCRRELWHRISDGSQPSEPVVEEALRFDTPIQTWSRRVSENIALDGVNIQAGDRLLLLFAAANHDPSFFENPEDFNPGRKDVARHFAFSEGMHFCMGAPLARLELLVMLQELSRRLPSVELVADQTFEYTPNITVRAPKQLLVTW